MISEDLADLLIEVNEVNGGHPLSYFEALTTAFSWMQKYTENIIAEFGLFGRLDAVNILKILQILFVQLGPSLVASRG